jgi:streptogramin lyase
MNRFIHIPILSCLLMLAVCPGCISEREPFVLLLDDSYTLRLLGTKEDGFTAPDGIAAESEHVLYLADQGGAALLKWTRENGAEILCGAEAGLVSPESVVRGRDGTLFFTDDSAGGVRRFTPGGATSLLAGPKQGLISTEGIVIAPDGALLVGEGSTGAVFRVTQAGSVSVYIPAGQRIEKVEAMAFDEAGNLYIADDSRKKILIVEQDHEPRVLLDSIDGIKAPESLAYHAGNLYITDGEAGKLYRWSRAAEELETIAIFHGELRAIQGVAVSDNGTIFLTVQCWQPSAGYLFALEPARRQ